MSTPTWGLDPKSRRITVYYTESSTIYEGMPVCYEFDATTNWMGVDGSTIDFTTTASSITESTTTAEGYQNEGKFIRVEDVDDDNVHAFAGVVAGADHAGETGPCALDIYIPNGAIVPVRTDASTTVGVTALGIANGSQLCASGGRPVAVAWETVDRSEVNGIVLAKLDPNIFLYQKGDAQALSYTGLTGAVANVLQNTFANTSGTVCGLLVHTTASGALAAAHNEWAVLGYMAVTGGITGAGYSRAVLGQLALSGTINSGGAVACGIHGQITGSVTNTQMERAAAGIFEYALSENPDTGDAEVLFLYANGTEDIGSFVHMHGDGEKATHIWEFTGCGGLSTSVLIKKMGTGGMWTNTGAWIQIPINVSGTTYYIPAGAALSEA
jgi:hypothetical protein